MNVDPALTGVLRSLLSLQTLGCIFQTGSGSRRRLWRCGMEQDNSCLSLCSMASNTESNLSPGDSRVLLHALDKVGTATASSSPALNSGTGLFHVSHCKLQSGEQDLHISCTSQGLQSPARLCPAQRIPGGMAWKSPSSATPCHGQGQFCYPRFLQAHPGLGLIRSNCPVLLQLPTTTMGFINPFPTMNPSENSQTSSKTQTLQ